jgi:hypothetical protein
MQRAKPRGVRAWVVTRHWIADYPKWEVAAVFSPRLGGVRVREFVELLYVTRELTLAEQTSMMWSRCGQAPYPAKFGQTKEGDPSECEILCGDDPYLHARMVDDLKVERDANGNESVHWKERPRGSSRG